MRSALINAWHFLTAYGLQAQGVCGFQYRRAAGKRVPHAATRPGHCQHAFQHRQRLGRGVPVVFAAPRLEHARQVNIGILPQRISFML